MSKETLEFIQRKTGMVYSDEQAALIDSKGGACVLACAVQVKPQHLRT